MRRITLMLFVTFCALLLLSTFSGSMPAIAQQPPTVTPVPLVTPTLIPELVIQNVLAEAQRVSADAAQKIDNANTFLSFAQGMTILFIIAFAVLGVIAALVFIDYRLNTRRTRELLGDVIEETKRLRVVEESVRIRFGDMQALSERVENTVEVMKNDLRTQLQVIYDSNNRQITHLQDVVNIRLRELDELRRDVEEDTQSMRNTIRDQLQVVYDRGDKQMKAVVDVLNNQVRDINTLRANVEATGQELRNTIRDQLHAIYDRGDRQTREWVAALNNGLKDLDTIRRDIELITHQMRDHIRDELQRIFERGDEQMRDLLESQNQHRQELDVARRELDSRVQTMRDHIRDELQAVYDRGNSQTKELVAAINDQLKQIELARSTIDGAASELRERIAGEIEAANANLGNLEALRKQVEGDQFKLGQALALAQNSQLEKLAQALTMTQVAQQYINKGNLRAAEASLRSALAVDADNRVVHHLLADVALRRGDVDDAMKHLEQAGGGKGEYPEADALYAYALRLQADALADESERERLYNQAAAILMKTLEAHPQLLDADGESVFGALASLYRRQGRIPQAINLYDYVRKVTPQNSYPLNNLGILHYIQGDEEVAKKFFAQSEQLAQQKINIDRADYWAWFDLITAQVAQGDPVKNINRDLETALNLPGEAAPLRKFLSGLEELRRAPNPPPNIDNVIEKIEREIESRQEVTAAG